MTDKISNLEFKIFERRDLDYFKQLILPNVYEQLFLSEGFEDEAVYCISATVDNVPVGVLVAQLFENEEVFIHSIVVGIEYRRMGIGCELIQKLMAVANEEFDPYMGEGENIVGLFLHTEYALDTETGRNYEAFLKAVGFTDFFDMPPVYCFTDENLKGLGRKSENVHSFSEIPLVNEDMLIGFFGGIGLTPAVKYCHYSGTQDEPGVVALVQYDDDDAFAISTIAAKENAEPEEYADVIFAVVESITKENPRFALIANEEVNIMPEFWDELAKTSGIKCEHREAGLYAQFE